MINSTEKTMEITNPNCEKIILNGNVVYDVPLAPTVDVVLIGENQGWVTSHNQFEVGLYFENGNIYGNKPSGHCLGFTDIDQSGYISCNGKGEFSGKIVSYLSGDSMRAIVLEAIDGNLHFGQTFNAGGSIDLGHKGFKIDVTKLSKDLPTEQIAIGNPAYNFGSSVSYSSRGNELDSTTQNKVSCSIYNDGGKVALSCMFYPDSRILDFGFYLS